MKLRSLTRPYLPPKASGCWNVQVARNAGRGHDSEVAEFIMRPTHEVHGILKAFGPGSRAYLKDGWRITALEQSRCRTGGLRGARARKRR